MTKTFHNELLSQIKSKSGKPTKHTFLNNYLGNDHPRYPIDNPTLRKIAREWMKQHQELKPDELVKLITSLVKGFSSTEKFMAGFLLDYATEEQLSFSPSHFDRWLEHVEGWAEIDALCHCSAEQLLENWNDWKKTLSKLSRSTDISKRRASMVLLCRPLRECDDIKLCNLAFEIVNRVKHERDGMITKAVSWILRSMITCHRSELSMFIREHEASLPAIAIRETKNKLKTEKK